MDEAQHQLVALDLEILIDRTAGFDGFAVGLLQCGQGEPAANGLFVFRVNIVGISYIDGGGHAGVRVKQGFLLILAEQRPSFLAGKFGRRAVVGELYHLEG
jgi:hypothetical protein